MGRRDVLMGGRRACIVLTIVCATPSCAPRDEVPVPDAEKQARIRQLGDLLQRAGTGGEVAVEPLVDRLESLCRFPPAADASRALARALVTAASSRALPGDVSHRLAQHLYVAMNGGYLRHAGLERLTGDTERTLVQAGVPAAAAAAVRVAVRRVAREPRDPRVDWW